MNPNKEYFHQLDFFRTLSAAMVVLYHNLFQSHFPGTILVNAGFLYVDFFFALSGFVIFHNYADRINSVGEFVVYSMARFARIYPLHLLTLMLFIGLEFFKYIANHYFGLTQSLLPFVHADGSAVVANLFLLTAHGVTRELTFNVPSWSIAAEFTAYLVFGLLALAFGARSRKFMAMGLVLVGLGSYTLWNMESMAIHFQLGWVRCLIGFFCGVFAYQIYASCKIQLGARMSLLVELGAIALFCGVFYAFEHYRSVNVACVMMGPVSALFILAFVSSTSGLTRMLAAVGKGVFGKISYGIYMWHYLVMWVMSQIFIRILGYPEIYDARSLREVVQVGAFLGDVISVATIVVVGVIAYFSYVYFEEPARKALRVDTLVKNK